jgi:hypothetical protein
MKKRNLLLLAAAVVASIYLMTTQNSSGEVNVNINVPLPGLFIPAPPVMAVMPGSAVYYPPEVSVDIFFYHGKWYRPHQQGWFISNGYNGPWRPVAVGRVPHAVTSIPPGYRNERPRYDRIAHNDMKKHWRGWERERYWDHDEKRRTNHYAEQNRGDRHRHIEEERGYRGEHDHGGH